ncbi:CbrC family protein [Sinomicrobium pectinilyticum]|uniref:CbrC family protein n=1 Tax=Sinomicrobium pectinilyticum TaxID=1084421 RepID=A0A3N0DQS7_SINP1|nr:CbrC family protein [Sinomicrobium pectinilyticum]RNL77994.1 CbrC family protein [Sinomicrobium pectinilyticum]
MELPKFKYSPNAFDLDLFDKEEGVCDVCNEKRNLKYNSSFYSREEPEYICPWCIANGKAAEKYSGEFNDYCGIEGVSPNPNDAAPAIPEELLLEITGKTPSYTSWQQEVWPTHCNEPCAFIGYADTKTIAPLMDELNEDIEKSGYGAELIKKHLSKDGSLVGYLFQCVNCGQHRLHVDSD